MTVSIEEKNTTNSICDSEDFEYKIEIATQTLERNINFITSCDNKTSIILTAFGVLLTIILTNDGLNEIYTIIKCCIEAKTFCNIFYLTCFGIFAFVMVFGMFHLGSVLIAKTSEKASGVDKENSRIFFSGIRQYEDYKIYCSKFYSMNPKELLDELVAQIYINADIATQKYNKYNRGLRCTVIGFFMFIIIFLIGIYLY